MTKTQIKNELSTKFYKVGLVEGAEESPIGYLKRIKEGVIWYLVGVYEKQGDVAIRRNIPIYCNYQEGTFTKEQIGVLDWEDLPEGEYFYGEKIPEEHIIPAPPITAFQDEINAKIQAKITDGTIKKGVIEEFSEKEEYAIVKAYQDEAGLIVEKKFFIHKDTAGTIQITLMSSVK